MQNRTQGHTPKTKFRAGFLGVGVLCIISLLAPIPALAAYTLTVAVKNISDNNTVSELTWNNVSSAWIASDQYLEVNYDSTSPGWGVEIYTNNHSTSPAADPYYTGNTANGYEGQGLIGVHDTARYCPMAWSASDDLLAGAPAVPGVDEIPGGAVWAYFKDPMQTAGSYPFTDGEQYITFVNGSGLMINNYCSRAAATAPVFLYFMANFRNLPCQTYKTNQLTVVLYHP